MFQKKKRECHTKQRWVSVVLSQFGNNLSKSSPQGTRLYQVLLLKSIKNYATSWAKRLSSRVSRSTVSLQSAHMKSTQMSLNYVLECTLEFLHISSISHDWNISYPRCQSLIIENATLQVWRGSTISIKHCNCRSKWDECQKELCQSSKINRQQIDSN